jgi:adenine-specific DNA-methyltransferase
VSTPYHAAYWAHLLVARDPSGSVESLSRSIANARLDLNPHQVEAALFALRSPLSKGVLLADEVGLGKTIEAGLVIAQRWAERRRRILIVVPATLRTQWQSELRSKFFLESLVLDGTTYAEARRTSPGSPFDRDDAIVIASYHFVAAKAEEIARVPWSLVVVDEAHRLRNVFRSSNKMARSIAEATSAAPKLLLTATPLQNSLMELYGLASVIDPHLFGDVATFREQFLHDEDEERRNRLLRARLGSIVVRTLRKQVVEYVPFTRRVPITQDFFPSDDEQRLYDDVSDYLRREVLVALPRSQRTLITLVLRKLLASSTVAIAATLRRLADRLERTAQGDDPSEIDELDEFEGLDELADELDMDNAPIGDPGDASDRSAARRESRRREEIAELRSFAAHAESIASNAKSDALLPALALAFERAEALGAPRKAVVFTESRRTQDFLAELLERSGYAGKVVLLNASNSDPASAEIYGRWIAVHRDSDRSTGSRAVDMKTAIVEHFRDHAEILVATEAAAEGINLQFCALVVNFDLPWNPQRIEQRIGRCHRYGQKHDVVVVNFINRRNEADQRVFQLLSEKFQLFDGIFGASDEVLGALESGVDIERRIAEVYRSCRTTEEIASAFEALQRELDEEIQSRLRETRAALFEHFDEDVRGRLRVHRDKTTETLSNRERWLLDLARYELADDATFEDDRPRFHYHGRRAHLEGRSAGADVSAGSYHLDWREAERLGDHFFRQDHPLAARCIEDAMGRPLEPARITVDLSGSGRSISALKPFVGRSGWISATKLAIASCDSSEFVLLTGTIEPERAGGRPEPLDDEMCRKLLSLPARIEGEAIGRPALDEARDTQIALRLRQADERAGRLLDEETLKLDRWSDDLKLGLERELRELDREITDARRESTAAMSLEDKLAAQRRIKSLEATRTSKRRELFEAQDAIDRERDELIAATERQLRRSHLVVPLFEAQWRLM